MRLVAGIILVSTRGELGREIWEIGLWFIQVGGAGRETVAVGEAYFGLLRSLGWRRLGGRG